MSDTHVLARLHEIIDFLKTSGQPQSIETLYKRFKIDDTLQGLINKSDQIIYNRSTRMLTFKQPFTFTNRESVYLYLKDHFYLDLSAAKKYYPQVIDDCLSLESENKIFVLKTKDQPKQAFMNLHPDIPQADEMFREAWNKIRIPDEEGLKKELVKRGLVKVNKSLVQIVSTADKEHVPKIKKVKRRMFQKKRTNIHMGGEDMI
eukprot:NODE_421_length_8910_cov_0.283623.p6 type:complete len:204 gc:universal NODE_421_length_8910_cov_0.283623:1798-2409(+)